MPRRKLAVPLAAYIRNTTPPSDRQRSHHRRFLSLPSYYYIPSSLLSRPFRAFLYDPSTILHDILFLVASYSFRVRPSHTSHPIPVSYSSALTTSQASPQSCVVSIRHLIKAQSHHTPTSLLRLAPLFSDHLHLVTCFSIPSSDFFFFSVSQRGSLSYG